MSDEELVIRFYTTHNDDDKLLNIEYKINGTMYEGIFINRYGELEGSITRDLTEALKKYTDMPKVYNKYILNKPSAIVQMHDRVSKAAHNASDRISNVVSNVFNPSRWGDSKKTAGKKTKSKRSPNANKTLKNRK